LKIEYASSVGDEVRIHKIIDKNTMKRIDTSKALQLPYKDLDKSKDKRWNAKKINAEMLSAIQSGEDISTMSERLIKVEKMNEVSAIRAARTMTTSFENLGRLDGMRAMKEDGTIIKKQWLATISTKKHPTREWHQALSGETAEIDEPFINVPNGEEAEEIMYPGDPNASAANVYNCRCTLTFVVEGFEPTLPKGTIKVVDDTANTQKLNIQDVFGDSLVRFSVSDSTSKIGLGGEKEKIANKLAELQAKYPMQQSITRKNYVTPDQLYVCDYDELQDILIQGKYDKRLNGGSIAQVFGEPQHRTVIGFRTNLMYESYESLSEKRLKAIKSKEILDSVCGACAETVTTHEWGHVMSDHITNGIIHDDLNSKAYWEWYKTLDKEMIRRGLSDYATVSRGEFEAECFCEMFMENPRPLALKYKKFLDEAIKRGY